MYLLPITKYNLDVEIEMVINILSWIIVGLMSGFLVYLLFDRDKRYFLGTLLSGVVGAFVGGIAYLAIRIGSTANYITPGSVFWATVGSLLLLGLITVLVKSEDQDSAVRHV